MTRIKTKEHVTIIAEDAFQLALKEAIAGKKCGAREVGGSLLGMQDAGRSIILYALPTGTNADQSGVHIVTDARYQNEWIRVLCRYYAGKRVRIVYLADYHSHSIWLSRLSSIDESCCIEILSDPDHAGLLGLPIILFTFRSDSSPVAVPFWVTLQGKRVVVESARLERVDATDARIKAVLRGCAYRPFESFVCDKRARNTAKVAYGTVDQTTQRRDLLDARLQLEMTDITRIFSSPATLRRTSHGMPFLTLTARGTTLVAAIPSEFPLNPPLIFVRRNDDKRFYECHATLPWNSLARISELFEDALESNTKQGEASHE